MTFTIIKQDYSFEVVHINERYKATETLGTGCEGTVQLFKSGSNAVAVKRIPLWGFNSYRQKQIEDAKREALNNNKIYGLGDYYCGDDEAVYILMKYIEGKTAEECMWSSLAEFLRVYIGYLEAVNEFHITHQMAHRDLTTGNVLLTFDEKQNKYYGKLIDLRTCRNIGESATKPYRSTNNGLKAPETGNEIKVQPYEDYFTAGEIMRRLKNEYHVVFKSFPVISEQLEECFAKMTDKEHPEKRMTITEMLKVMKELLPNAEKGIDKLPVSPTQVGVATAAVSLFAGTAISNTKPHNTSDAAQKCSIG